MVLSAKRSGGSGKDEVGDSGLRDVDPVADGEMVSGRQLIELRRPGGAGGAEDAEGEFATFSLRCYMAEIVEQGRVYLADVILRAEALVGAWVDALQTGAERIDAEHAEPVEDVGQPGDAGAVLPILHC